MPWVDYSDENPIQGEEENFVLIEKSTDEFITGLQVYKVRTNGNNIAIYQTDGQAIKEKYEGTIREDGSLAEIRYYDVDINASREEAFYLKRKREFNKNNQIIKLTFFLSDGNIRSTTDYTYDEKGYLTEDISTDENGVVRKCYFYDNNGNLIKRMRYDDDDNITASEEWIYNNNGNLIKYTKNGKILDEWIYNENKTSIHIYGSTKEVYDEKGNIIEYYKMENDGNEILTKKYEYNEKGNVIKFFWYDQEGNVLDSAIHTYDENGNLISSCYYLYENGISIDKTDYEYDCNGNKIKSTSFFDGSISSVSEWKYDDTGNLIEYTNIYKEFKQKYIYKYDDYGNNTREIKYSGDNVLYVRGVWG